jgi:hypothetical protein
MIDNLFIVESPLQALIAVELSLQFQGQVNGIIYRLSGKQREHNDEQILRVVEHGNWSFKESIQFGEAGGGLAWHIHCRSWIVKLRKQLRNKVRTVFFGEFRSQWMHFARFAVAPERAVLMDDGAATITVKKQFIDHGIYYPKDCWLSKSFVKKAVKEVIFSGFIEKAQARKPLLFASAFLKDESEFKVDFSEIRGVLTNNSELVFKDNPKAYYFGSKYSEAGIVSQSYELEFITKIIAYYRAKGLSLVYCAHRDESNEKLSLIRHIEGLQVIRPGLPAELFLLERDADISEIGASYSSVINNLSLIFPDKPITSFRLDPKAINPNNREAIEYIYKYFEKEKIFVKDI